MIFVVAVDAVVVAASTVHFLYCGRYINDFVWLRRPTFFFFGLLAFAWKRLFVCCCSWC